MSTAMVIQSKSETVCIRMTAYERLLAEAMVAKRQQPGKDPYSLTDLVRAALMSEVRADLTQETRD